MPHGVHPANAETCRALWEGEALCMITVDAYRPLPSLLGALLVLLQKRKSLTIVLMETSTPCVGQLPAAAAGHTPVQHTGADRHLCWAVPKILGTRSKEEAGLLCRPVAPSHRTGAARSPNDPSFLFAAACCTMFPWPLQGPSFTCQGYIWLLQALLCPR